MSTLEPQTDIFTIANCLFNSIKNENIRTIADVSASHVSLETITQIFPEAKLFAHPVENIGEPLSAAYTEIPDMSMWKPETKLDLVFSELYFGKTAKEEGKNTIDLLEQLLAIPSRYTILIDYLEDKRINWKALVEKMKTVGTILWDVDLPCTEKRIFGEFEAHNHR